MSTTVTAQNNTGASGVTSTTYIACTNGAVSKPKVKRRAMRPVRVTAHCPVKKCRGEMVMRGGMTAGMGPTHWRHTCDKCGHQAWYADSFPHIAYEALP